MIPIEDFSLIQGFGFFSKEFSLKSDSEFTFLDINVIRDYKKNIKNIIGLNSIRLT